MGRKEEWFPPEERVLHALGQLHRLSSQGRLPVAPDAWDPVDVAAVLGLSATIELVVEHPYGTAHHFSGAVLVTYPDGKFPWELEDPATWADYCDTVDERWADSHRPDES